MMEQSVVTTFIIWITCGILVAGGYGIYNYVKWGHLAVKNIFTMIMFLVGGVASVFSVSFLGFIIVLARLGDLYMEHKDKIVIGEKTK